LNHALLTHFLQEKSKYYLNCVMNFLI